MATVEWGGRNPRLAHKSIAYCPTDAIIKRRNYRKLQIGTAECTGNVHGINRVLSCTCKVLLRQEIHLTLADAKATGGDS